MLCPINVQYFELLETLCHHQCPAIIHDISWKWMDALSVLENTIFSIPRFYFLSNRFDEARSISNKCQVEGGHQPSRTFLDMGSNGLITRSVRATVVIVMRTLCLLHVSGQPNIGKGATFDQWQYIVAPGSPMLLKTKRRSELSFMLVSSIQPPTDTGGHEGAWSPI